ncbi:MAG TPA: lysophospholipid acyltransferase family protein [Vicinamibacteria bacterium]|nr:lysophospholipid acyltransferase family protein [Vicinamibacteria bacterium]
MTRAQRFAWEERAVRAASALCAWLPRGLVLRLGRALGRLLADLDRRHVEITRDNLRRAFPDWDETRVRRTARDVYAHFGLVVLDILWLSQRTREQVLALVDVVNKHHLEALRPAGGIMVTGHLGNWELCGVAHGYVFRTVGVVARPLDNPALDRRLVAFRERGGNHVIYKQKALAHVLRALRERRDVAFLIDQNVQEKDGIFIRFFGRPAAATTVVAALAVKTGCPVIGGHTVLLPDGRYRQFYDPPLYAPSTGDREADIAAMTQALADMIEGWVRETPEQWLWMHRRWKTQPAPAVEQPREPIAAPAEPSA